MDLSVAQSCPGCGATIVLREDDRLVRCSYCDSNNYRSGMLAARYFLPPMKIGKHIEELAAEDRLVYVPYIRFRGSVFYLKGTEVGYKVVDTSRIGTERGHLPPSLGLRPQAVSLQPVVAKMAGRFLPQTVPTKEAFIHAAQVFELFENREKLQVYHKAFIGETLSRIYLPCVEIAGRLFDCVDGREIGHGETFRKLADRAGFPKPAWEPRFIQTVCPACGGELDGETDSLVLRCTNCEKLWMEEKRKFVPVDWEVITSGERNALNIPFWKLEIEFPGGRLESFADLLQFANLPAHRLQLAYSKPLAIYIPALKLRPKSFLQVAAQISLGQHKLPDGGVISVRKDLPVTLHWKEALQAVKSVVGFITIAREKRFPELMRMKVRLRRCQLVYLVFRGDSHDQVQPHTGANIQTAALKYSRFL